MTIVLSSCGTPPILQTIVTVVLGAGKCSSTGIIVLTARDVNQNDVLDSNDDEIKSQVLCQGDSITNDFKLVEILDPCGDAEDISDDKLFRISDGTILYSYGDALKTRIIGIPAPLSGKYLTTDGSGCIFTLTSSGVLKW